MDTALLVNPTAGRGNGRSLAEGIKATLEEAGVRCALHYTRAAREAIGIVRSLSETHERILVAGGDGTWLEAVNGALTAARRPVLGLVPVGTGNDFAKMLGYGNDWQAACQRIARGGLRRIDIGRCSFGYSPEPSANTGHNSDNAFYFANGAGIGFDAEVSREAQRIRFLRGNSVYLLALVRTLMLRYATPHVKIKHDQGYLQQTITLVAVANGQCYGGAFRIAPEAAIDDGLLDLVCATGMGRLRILGFLPRVLRGKHLESPLVRTFKTRRVSIRSEVPLPLHLDGEVMTNEATHLEIELLPGALQILA